MIELIIVAHQILMVKHYSLVPPIVHFIFMYVLKLSILGHSTNYAHTTYVLNILTHALQKYLHNNVQTIVDVTLGRQLTSRYDVS